MVKKVPTKQARAKAKAEAAAKKTDAPMDDEDDAGRSTQEEESDDGMPSTKKRHVPNEQLSEQQEQTLVEWFHEHSLFYDQTEKDFKTEARKTV